MSLEHVLWKYSMALFFILRLWNGGVIKMNASPKLNVDMALMFPNLGFV